MTNIFLFHPALANIVSPLFHNLQINIMAHLQIASPIEQYYTSPSHPVTSYL